MNHTKELLRGLWVAYRVYLGRLISMLADFHRPCSWFRLSTRTMCLTRSLQGIPKRRFLQNTASRELGLLQVPCLEEVSHRV